MTFAYQFTILVLAVPVFATACGDNIAIGADSEWYTPQWESVDCKPVELCEYAPLPTEECGYLIVPENRRNPSGNQIKIYITIFKNNSSSNTGEGASAPFVYLTGGPGAETRTAKCLFRGPTVYRDQFGNDRDIIVVDQRGTNQSEPSLYCSQELGPKRMEAYSVSYDESAALRIQGQVECRQRLEEEGIDLSGYNSLENAADINDLATVLGYKQFNLYGASYGTRLTMIIMKEYPELARAAVLDSVLTPEVNAFAGSIPGTLFGLQQFFEAARAQFPTLEVDFDTLMTQLDETPQTIIVRNDDVPVDVPVLVNGTTIANFVIQEIGKTPYNKKLPSDIIHMSNSGDYQMTAEAWVKSINFMFPDKGPGSLAPSVGMFNSVFGANDAHYTNATYIMEEISYIWMNPALENYLENTFIGRQPTLLGEWNVEPLEVKVRVPLVTDTPVLMTVGAFDPFTPATFSLPSRQYLANNFYFDILGGHAVTFLPCATNIVGAFLNNPTQRPKNMCPTQPEWNP